MIQMTHHRWRLTVRKGVYAADGRSNVPPVGRHSLGTRDRDEALRQLQHLDTKLAVDEGRVERSAPTQCPTSELPLERGVALYEAEVCRSRVAGGASPRTWKRYRAVLDKFCQFAKARGVLTWSAVDRATLSAYGAHLEANRYAAATQYLELTLLKQINKHLVEAGLLPQAARIRLRLSKPSNDEVYCWRPAEVAAMLEHCGSQQDLRWLHGVLATLAYTGLRISELAGLRRSDIDFESKMIRLTDERSSTRRKLAQEARELKGRRGRSLPVHLELQPILAEIKVSKDGLLFRGPLGGKLKPDTVRRIFVRDVLTPLAKRFPKPPGAAVGFSDGRLHSFRHYFCSVCAASGRVSEQTLMSWLGHRHSSMIRHYYHLHDAESQRQMSQIEFLPKNLVAGKVPAAQPVEEESDPAVSQDQSVDDVQERLP
jgi:integrase